MHPLQLQPALMLKKSLLFVGWCAMLSICLHIPSSMPDRCLLTGNHQGKSVQRGLVVRIELPTTFPNNIFLLVCEFGEIVTLCRAGRIC